MMMMMMMMMIIIATTDALHPWTTRRVSSIPSFSQKNMFVEYSSRRSVGVATSDVLRNLCSQAFKSDRTKVAGTISGQ
jgi:hypothetical protein